MIHNLLKLIPYFPFVALTLNLLRDVGGKFSFVCGKCYVICVSRVGAACIECKPTEMDIEHMADQVGDNWRAGTTLWQRVLITGNLGEHSRHVRVQREVPVLNEEATHAPKVYRSKEVLKVDVKHISPLAVFRCVSDDRAVTLETVR